MKMGVRSFISRSMVAERRGNAERDQGVEGLKDHGELWRKFRIGLSPLLLGEGRVRATSRAANFSSRGLFGGLGYIRDFKQECAEFHKRSVRIIKLLTVQEILDGERA